MDARPPSVFAALMHALLLAALLWSGSIDGRVVSAASGEAVPQATVALDSLGYVVRTAADGSFRLDSVPAGAHGLRITAPGYRPRALVVYLADDAATRIDVELTPVAPPAPGDERGSIEGVVTDADQGAPVSGAEARLVELDRRRSADDDGRFAFRGVPAGRWTVRVDAIGYRPAEIAVVVDATTVPLDVRLPLRPVRLPGLTVEGTGAVPAATFDLAPEARVVDTEYIRRVPVAAELDVMRAVQTLPAVTPSSDFSAALFVRGGTPDQTRVLLDGVPVQNSFHLGGFFSAFTPSAVAGAALRPGGLPASAPSSLSGTLEVYTRDGRRDRVRARGGLGLLSSAATGDGPLPSNLGTFLLSARRTYLDLALRAGSALGLVDDPPVYGFTDVYGKAAFDLGGGASLALSGYHNRDAFEVVRAPGEHESADGGWGNDLLALDLRVPATDRLRGRVLLSTSEFEGELHTTRGRTPPFEEARVRPSLHTLAADVSVTGAFGDHTAFAGVRWERNATDHVLEPDLNTEDFIPELTTEGMYGSVGVYLRDRWRVGGGWTLDGGLRLERPRGRGWEPMPRLRIERSLGASHTLSLGGGRYIQDWWSLRNEESAYASLAGYDLTVPAPRDRPLPTGWDAVLEAETRVRPAGTRLRTALFYKRLSDVPTTPPDIEPLRAPLVLHPASVRLGTGTVAGVELSAVGSVLGSDLSLSYRWQRERRRLDGLSFTPRSERRHRLVLAGTRGWGERQVAFALTWMSGQPYTPVAAALPTVDRVGSDGRPRLAPLGAGVLVFDTPNSARLPAYLRLDVDLRGSWDMTVLGRRGTLEPYVSVLNVLNEHNAFVADHSTPFDGRLFRELGPQLPVLPSFGLRWSF